MQGIIDLSSVAIEQGGAEPTVNVPLSHRQIGCLIGVLRFAAEEMAPLAPPDGPVGEILIKHRETVASCRSVFQAVVDQVLSPTPSKDKADG